MSGIWSILLFAGFHFYIPAEVLVDEKGLPENYIIPSLGKLNIQVNKRTKGKVTR